MLLFFAVLIILAILSIKLSGKLGLPLLIGFILIGFIVGSDVLNLFYFEDTILTERIGNILLIFIIFDGGFRVPRSAFNSVAGPSLTLATVGVALTAAFLGLFVHFVLKFDLIFSLLMASIISSTDAAAVFMITKANPIKEKLATTLNVESAANDPMAILLTITFIQIATNAFKSPTIAALILIWQFFGGVIIGYLCYQISLFILDRLHLTNRADYNVLILGCILGTYGISDAFKANGIIAVFFMGYWLGNSSFPAKLSVSNFLKSVSALFNIALFIMLGLLSFPHRFVHIWQEALIIVGIMMFVARPLATLICVYPFNYTSKEKLFLMWGGIKGAVPVVLATYPAANGIENSGFIFDTIFFAVFLSCIIQGTTLGSLAKLLKLTERRRPETSHVVELHSLQKCEVGMFEIHIEENAPSHDQLISNLDLGKDVLISSIVRDGKIVFPKGSTKIKKNDTLFILAKSTQIDEIDRQLNSDSTVEPDRPPDQVHNESASHGGP